MESRHPHLEACESTLRGVSRDRADGAIALARPAAAIGRNGDCSTRGTRPPTGMSSSASRLQLRELREELQRGVQFAHRQERTSSYVAEEMAMTEELWASQEAELEELERRMQHGMNLHGSRRLGDDEDEDSEEIAAFLGLSVSIPSNQAQSMAIGSLQEKSSSFSRRSRMVPCSPPVPIPQKHWKRRNSISTSSQTPSESLLIPSHEQQYSRSQCEARLWDEHWNFKLSLESRESFEASASNQRDTEELNRSVHSSAINRTQSPKPRTVSETSTEDTAGESCDDGGADPEVDVFAMDDL